MTLKFMGVSIVGLALLLIAQVSAMPTALRHPTSVAVSSAARNDAASTAWPKDQCGWPWLFQDHINTPTTVKLCQGLMNYALMPVFQEHFEPLVVDGDFGPKTKAAVELFQKHFKVDADYAGAMGPPTWTKLTTVAQTLKRDDATKISSVKKTAAEETSRRYGVEALQTMLSFNAYPTPVTGHFDNTTVASLSLFEKHRGASSTEGDIVTRSGTS